jgi:hypothetical protein
VTRNPQSHHPDQATAQAVRPCRRTTRSRTKPPTAENKAPAMVTTRRAPAPHDATAGTAAAPRRARTRRPTSGGRGHPQPARRICGRRPVPLTFAGLRHRGPTKQPACPVSDSPLPDALTGDWNPATVEWRSPVNPGSPTYIAGPRLACLLRPRSRFASAAHAARSGTAATARGTSRAWTG